MTTENSESVGDRIQRALQTHANLTEAVEKTRALLDDFSRQLQTVEQETLPNLLREMGADKWQAPDGTAVSMTEEYTASVSSRNQAEAIRILERIGARDVCRTAVSFEFTADDEQRMMDLLNFSQANKLACSEKMVLHPGTLKKVVREGLRDGLLQPNDLEPLGVFTVTRAKVKAPKEE